MTERRPPGIEMNWSDLPTDAQERHEVLVDIFGRYVFWLRDWALGATRRLAQSEQARDQLGAIWRVPYDRLAAASPEQIETVCRVCEATLDRFIQLFLTMLAGTGVDHRLGEQHAMNFKLDIEICDVHTREVVEQETINRHGKRYFADYWGQWLNKCGAIPEKPKIG